MISILPIDEPAVLDELSQGRFASDIAGYVVMDGARYCGFALYRVENGVTQVLACDIADTALVDGAVRACIAAGEDAGATLFSLRTEDAALAGWARVFVKDAPMPLENAHIFHACG